MKIQIIGGSGCGKSTLGKALAERCGVPWIDCDRYLWKDTNFTENYPIAERFAMYETDRAACDDYVASGSVRAWHPDGFSDRELYVLMVLDERQRLQRLYDREYARFGARMLPGGGHYALTRDFLAWCETYLTEDENAVCSLAAHKKWLKDAGCKTLELDASQPTERLCEQILAAYGDGTA